MPSLSGIPAVDVLIGLFFLYFLLSIVCSSINEGISSILRTRAKFLELGIRSLLDGDANAKAFYDHSRVQALIKPAGKIFKGTRKPSYMPGRVFALTVLDTFAPPPAGTESEDLIDRTSKAVRGHVANPTIKGILEDALLEARGDVDRFRPRSSGRSTRSWTARRLVQAAGPGDPLRDRAGARDRHQRRQLRDRAAAVEGRGAALRGRRPGEQDRRGRRGEVRDHYAGKGETPRQRPASAR